MKEMNFSGFDCVVVKTKYMNNDNLAIMLLEKGAEMSSPVAIATVNTDELLDENQAYVKSYSENSGMLEALEKEGLVKKVLGHKRLGYVTAPLVEFNLEGVSDIEEFQ